MCLHLPSRLTSMHFAPRLTRMVSENTPRISARSFLKLALSQDFWAIAQPCTHPLVSSQSAVRRSTTRVTVLCPTMPKTVHWQESDLSARLVLQRHAHRAKYLTMEKRSEWASSYIPGDPQKVRFRQTKSDVVTGRRNTTMLSSPKV